MHDGSSFQAQCSFTTAGAGAPTENRLTRCAVSRNGVGTFFVQAVEDIALGSCEYALAGSLDSNGVAVALSIVKQSAFVWKISTSQIAGGMSELNRTMEWTGSGTLSTANGAAVNGFIADANEEVGGKAAAIEYPLDHASATITLQVFVDSNTLAAGVGPATGITTFTVYKNGAPTAATIDVNPAATGLFTLNAVVAYAVGDTFDLQASMPGAADAGAIRFGASLDFKAAIVPAQLAVVDTVGCTINLTLRRVDPA